MNCQDIPGDKTPQDPPRENASFYWGVVHPYFQGAMAYLCVNEEGRQWITNLQANMGVAKPVGSTTVQKKKDSEVLERFIPSHEGNRQRLSEPCWVFVDQSV